MENRGRHDIKEGVELNVRQSTGGVRTFRGNILSLISSLEFKPFLQSVSCSSSDVRPSYNRHSLCTLEVAVGLHRAELSQWH